MFIAITLSIIDDLVVFFAFCKQQTKTEFAFAKTELALNFNSIGIIFVCSDLFRFGIFILTGASEPLSGKVYTRTVTETDIVPVAIYLISKHSLRIMSGSFLRMGRF